MSKTIQNLCLARNLELSFLAKAHLRLAEDHDDVLSIAGSESFPTLCTTLYILKFLESSSHPEIQHWISPVKAVPA